MLKKSDKDKLKPAPAVPVIPCNRGPRGFPGIDGDIGMRGATGKPGPIGDPGPMGPRGQRGPIGPNGINGVNGKDGINGINGKDGVDGKDGKDGKDAPGTGNTSDDDNLLLNVMSLVNRETTRHMLGSGVVSTSYAAKRMTNEPRDHRIDSAPFSPMAIHNHPNYNGMPGMGWFTVHANGHIVQTRHNDYRMFKKVVNKNTGKIEYVENKHRPMIPTRYLNIDSMRRLMSDFNVGNKTFTKEEKAMFRWDLSYLEVFTVTFDSLDDKIGDSFPSFRHGFGNITVRQLVHRYSTYRNTGIKERFENAPFLPITKTEDGKYAVTYYGIATEPLSEYNGMRWNELMDKREGFTTSPRSEYDYRFRIKNIPSPKEPRNPRRSLIDDIIENVRGFNPTPINEFDINPSSFNDDAYDDVYDDKNNRKVIGHDYSFYRRTYEYELSDATNVRESNLGWNDANHISALVLDPKYPERATYMVPLEMILRTPLETWNPENIKHGPRGGNSGDGKTAATAFAHYHEDYYFYHTPSSVYQGQRAPGLGADTGGRNWVKDIHGSSKECNPSGIHIFHNGFEKGEHYMRTRFPIALDAMETGLVGHMIDGAMKVLEDKISKISKHIGIS